MNNKPEIKIFVDFNNADVNGRIRLNTVGSLHDIAVLGEEIRVGLEVLLDDEEELSIKGVVEFSFDEDIWIAKVDWDELMSIIPNKDN
jgi:hypothetical protein